MSSSAENMASVPIVVTRFSDGMTIAKDAFARNTIYTNNIATLAAALGQDSHPLTIIPLLAPPTYEELDTLFNLTAPTAPGGVDFPLLPSPPAPPTAQFSYSESAYISPVGSALQTATAAKIIAGGTGLGADIETGIWNREQERALIEHSDSLARLEDDLAAGGFSLPGGSEAWAIIDHEIKFTDARLTSNRDIATKQAEIAHDQQTKILEVGASVETVNTSYATAMRNRLLEAAKAGPQIAVDLFRAQVEYVNAFVAQYNALAAKANAQAEIFKAQIMGYSAQIDTKAKIVDASVRRYSSAVEGVFRANESEIAKDSLFVQELIAFLNMQLEAMKAVSQVNAQIAASALTGMSASASIGGAEQQSFSISEQDSTSKNLNYNIQGTP